eukprot:gnl/Chilomastix_caulleri/908.p1 GENE.gnl/Chilomastix_caulleri/908~~gnl/Chilomastix_caulleri/908.p1  ORF type:complete len:264 (+),score=66.37 gnl/Chilomastix_caulleri/908:75-866(+)
MSFASPNSGYGSQNQQPTAGPGVYKDERYNSLKNQITAEIRKIALIKSRLERINSALGTPQDTPSIRTELQTCIKNCNQIEANIRQLFKELATMQGNTLSEREERRLTLNTLQKTFDQHVNDFKNIARLSTNKAATVTYVAPTDNNQAKDNEQRLKQIEILNDRITNQEIIVAERERDIKALHEDLTEMHSIAQNVNIMIEDQGVKLNYVDTKVSEAADLIDEGVEEIKIADTFHKKSVKKYWWVILICVIAVVVIIFLACFL